MVNNSVNIIESQRQLERWGVLSHSLYGSLRGQVFLHRANHILWQGSQDFLRLLRNAPLEPASAAQKAPVERIGKGDSQSTACLNLTSRGGNIFRISLHEF